MERAAAYDPRLPVAADDTVGVWRAFEAGGAVHVRAAVPISTILEVRAAAHAALAAWARLALDGALPDELAAPLARRFVPLEWLGLDQERVGALLHPICTIVARAYLDRTPEFDPNSHVRSILLDRADAHLPFHQDQTILRKRLLNVWIPLDACGHDAPGLEVVSNSWLDLLAPSPEPEAQFPVELARLDPSVVLSRYGAGSCWAPEFRRGDAMLFAGATIHRTYVTAAMTAGRMSAEIRLL